MNPAVYDIIDIGLLLVMIGLWVLALRQFKKLMGSVRMLRRVRRSRKHQRR